MTATLGEIATLAHDFTMADIERASRISAYRARTGTFLTWGERYDIAWMAIVEEIYTAQEKPDLVEVGMSAVGAESKAHLRHHGVVGLTGANEFTPRFRAYWHHVAAETDFTDGIVDRLALAQVLGVLTPKEYEAIAALAALGSSVAAAKALGLSRPAFKERLRRARAKIFALWYAPETPRDLGRYKLTPDGQCTYGHDLTEHGVIYDGRLRCRRCKRNDARRKLARNRS